MSKKKGGRLQSQQQGSIQDEIQVYLNQHPNANIKDVLDQKEAIDLSGPCLKSFIKFVTRDNETLMSLIYLIDANESELSEEQLKRYPFIASESFKHDQIVDFLFNSDNCKEFLDNIFKILEADYLITTVAGYFAKVINQLVKKKGLNLWQYIISCGANVIQDLIKHLYDYNIAKAVQDLIILNTYILENQSTFFDERICLVGRIFNYMIEKKYNPSIVENVSDILIQVLHEINAYDEKSHILSILCKPESIYHLIFYTQSTLVVKFLNELINSLIQYIEQTKQKQPEFTFNFGEFQLLGNNFQNLLKQDLQISSNYLPIQAPFQTTYNEEQQQPFGQYRLQLIEFYYKVLRANDKQLMGLFNHKEIYTILLGFLGKHEFNNALQNLFINITMYIFGSDLAEIQQAYYDANLFEYLKFFGLNKTTQVGQIKKQITRGYMGVVNKLVNFFRTYQEQSWIQFLETHQQILDIENHYFFDFNPHEGEENEVEATCNIEQLQQNIIELIQPKIKLSVKEFGQVTEVTGESQLIEEEIAEKDSNKDIQQQVQPNFENLQIETNNQEIEQKHKKLTKNSLTADLTPQMQKGQKTNTKDKMSKSDQLYLPKDRIVNQEEKQNHEEFLELLQKHIKIILQESIDLEKKLEKYYNLYQKRIEKLSQSSSGSGQSKKLESSSFLFQSKIVNQQSEIEEEEEVDNFRRRTKSMFVNPNQQQY